MLATAVGAGSAGILRDFSRERFPVSLTERNTELMRTSCVFANDEWSDYLHHRFCSDQRVLFDGRVDFYGEQQLGEFKSTYLGRPGLGRASG